MSPLFQLVLFNFLFRWPPLFGRTFYSTTGFIQQLQLLILFQLFYSTLIQLFIPMAALIWSHFLFNNWFYSTTATAYLIPTVLFNSYSTFYSDGRPYLVALFIQQLVLFNNCNCLSYSNCFIQLLFNFLFRWLPLFGRTFYSTTVLFNCLSYSNCFIQLLFPPFDFIQLFILMAALIWSHFLFNFLFLFNLNGRPYLVLSSFFFFFFFGKKGVYLGFEPETS